MSKIVSKNPKKPQKRKSRCYTPFLKEIVKERMTALIYEAQRLQSTTNSLMI